MGSEIRNREDNFVTLRLRTIPQRFLAKGQILSELRLGLSISKRMIPNTSSGINEKLTKLEVGFNIGPEKCNVLSFLCCNGVHLFTFYFVYCGTKIYYVWASDYIVSTPCFASTVA